jgi:AraC-like DNA-binding protein
MESFCAHLTAHQRLVRAGTDITVASDGWLFLRVCSGGGYLMSGPVRQEIGPGDLVVIPAANRPDLRASQLGDLRLCQFGIQPEQLTGFFTAGEQQAFQYTVRQGAGCARVFKPEVAAARLHASLCGMREQEPAVLVRATMLVVAVQALRDLLTQIPSVPGGTQSAGEKFTEMVARVPESEILRRSVTELAHECGCSERHFRRLFAKRFGVSLLRRQIEWRIEKARRLLMETDAKVIDIAQQCGFQSLGQFNQTFKRHTRFSPGAWRTAFAVNRAKFKRQHPPRCPRLGIKDAHFKEAGTAADVPA